MDRMNLVSHSWSAVTVEDIISLNHKAVELFLLDDSVYCDRCDIEKVERGEKYCVSCVSDILEDMAVKFKEQYAVEGGLY